MALRIYTGKKRVIASLTPDEDGEREMVCTGELGKTMDISDLFEHFEKADVLKISFPEEVECIEPGTFTGFASLEEVEIRGDVYGVEWQGGTAWMWTAQLSPSMLVEELKRGAGRILIHRMPQTR